MTDADLQQLAADLGRAPGPASAAARALAARGERVLPLVLAALDDPGRRIAASLALARIAAPS